MKTKALPFESPGVGKAYVLQVDPVEPFTEDAERWWEPDEALWLFAGALDGANCAPYRQVWNYCRRWSESPPVLMVAWALWHPQTPYAMGYRPPHRQPGSDVDMFVNWRGRMYTRNRQGVLTVTGERLPHPSPRAFWRAFDSVRRMQDEKSGAQR